MNRYRYKRKVRGDSGRDYNVSFDTALGCWMCSCPSCTRRRSTCKHLQGLDRLGPEYGGQDTPPAGARCPCCSEDRLDDRDMIVHLAEHHPSVLRFDDAYGVFVCACGFQGSIKAMEAHLSDKADLGAHFAEGVMARSAGVR